MAELKTYKLTCPDSDCGHEFELACDPEALAEGGELIECPDCKDEWEWEHDLETDTLELLADDFEEDDEPATYPDIDDEDEDDDAE